MRSSLFTDSVAAPDNARHITIPLPPSTPACRMTVVIPARNEEDDIVRCLDAIASQTDLTTFDVVVFANNCTDRTAERARLYGRNSRLNVNVFEHTLPANAAHVGSARKMLMDCAAARFLAAGNPHGIVATTDADTIVAPDWVDQTIEEMRFVDAVAGFVEVSPVDQQVMLAPARLLYAREKAYRRASTELESLIDPRPEDPPPRHGAFVGASFAVSAGMYYRAGGLLAVPCLEDREFLFALQRVDARIRYSLQVLAWTSGRRIARVAGGFGTFLGHLHEQARSGQTLLVENPRQTLNELEGRAALRRIWRDEQTNADIALVGELFEFDRTLCLTAVNRLIPFGLAFERVVSLAGSRRAAYPMVPVDEAIAVLRAAAASRKAVSPTRSITASGAG